VTPDPDFNVGVFFEIKHVQTVLDRAIVTSGLDINTKSHTTETDAYHSK